MSNSRPKYLTSLPVFTGNAPACGPRTVVCFGVARGGTSMVAGAILGLGVNMGPDLGHNLEDPAFNMHGQGADFIDTARKAIAARNAAHDIWGWKFPYAARHLPDLMNDLRAPHLVCVYRDPVTTALRKLKDDESATDFAVARLKAQVRNTKMIEELGVPALMVSYEKAVARPRNFLNELADFLGLAIPDHVDEIVDFMAPGRYKDPKGLIARLDDSR